VMAEPRTATEPAGGSAGGSAGKSVGKSVGTAAEKPGARVDASASGASTPLRHRLAERGIDRLLLLLLPAVATLIALFLYPMMYGVGLSLQPRSGGIFANYVAFFTDPYQSSTVWKTMRLALPAALFNVLVSVPIAYRLRGRFRGKRLLTAILVLPVTLGTVLVADGILRYFGPRGWFNRVLLELGLVDEPVRLIYNYWGVMFSLIITGFPFAFLLVLSYMSGIDPTLERAAATLGAGPWQRVRRITLPLLAAGPRHHVHPLVRAGVLGVPLGEPGGRTRRRDPGDGDRGLPGGVREVRLHDGVHDRRADGRVRADRDRAGAAVARAAVRRAHGR